MAKNCFIAPDFPAQLVISVLKVVKSLIVIVIHFHILFYVIRW